MQRLINQRAKLSIYRQNILGYFHYIRRHAYEKNRIRFAINCKSSGFSI
ncbi:hypothetical protein HMPREF0542_10440 [Ligilactobacillus ruminis ATCC 25644]|uniref:Uncharacterized protein n=1 Tax=Ligilactobacillus ruminis ATCC 25644 TaxID=525362 RepID=E7FNG3_9LACO|nr:hypothetical protein HMPREF0542_10440 [Ligilactobacillus ruminis ATCC 25644]EGX98120.1 hypothetical protein ANHS_1330 [Ligilactobacillus ruminis ATCC 25644]